LEVQEVQEGKEGKEGKEKEEGEIAETISHREHRGQRCRSTGPPKAATRGDGAPRANRALCHAGLRAALRHRAVGVRRTPTVERLLVALRSELCEPLSSVGSV